MALSSSFQLELSDLLVKYPAPSITCAGIARFQQQVRISDRHLAGPESAARHAKAATAPKAVPASAICAGVAPLISLSRAALAANSTRTTFGRAIATVASAVRDSSDQAAHSR